MLAPELIRKIRKIHIRTGRMVNSMMAGQYRSVFRGTGIEFEEVRDYSPGDEVKSIDWKVSARLGRPFVKLYREERELIVMLLVDMSASGLFGTHSNRKKDTIVEIAAILAFNAIRNNDKVGAILFTDRVEKYIPPPKGSAHIWRVIKEMFTFEPTHPGTDIRGAAAYFGRVCRKRSICFVISDFMADEYMHALKVASKKHELVSILISDSGEFELPAGGIVTARDLETGRICVWDACSENIRRSYAARARSAYARRVEQMKAADIDCVELATDDSGADALTRYFRSRERKIR
jgi:uncharacterized protein (DUF58 family)